MAHVSARDNVCTHMGLSSLEKLCPVVFLYALVAIIFSVFFPQKRANWKWGGERGKTCSKHQQTRTRTRDSYVEDDGLCTWVIKLIFAPLPHPRVCSYFSFFSKP
ncbi:hypothetical protein XENOCAPTIV_015507 [Xenoophorus captivus]|uniref:Uncharacterized protein n=1 Tax=Xenoophorus captivus TaxID=1517983 RepID=A0ABV0RQN8_9TELE